MRKPALHHCIRHASPCCSSKRRKGVSSGARTSGEELLDANELLDPLRVAVRKNMDANRPFVIRYGWTNGGGHIMVGRGDETVNGVNYLYIMNPWQGEEQTDHSYSSAVSASDHKWTHTQRMNING
ncbi:hypothetical protein [Rugamonas rubra]|nr:hypothetical protein [Rugamonas rubra]